MARSGTSWCQRVTTELNDIGMPPETRFFPAFFKDLVVRNREPLNADTIRGELDRYVRYPGVRGFGVDADRVIDLLNGHCSRPLDLFSAIVQAATGEARLYGEKTPRHYRHWLPLSRALPELKFIWLIRDPRAVISSVMKTPWGPRLPVEIRIEQWRKSVAAMTAAQQVLGKRLLVVPYEAMIGEGEDTFRARVAAFLGVSNQTGHYKRTTIHPFESSWKANVDQSADVARLNAWTTELDPGVAAHVTRQCAAEIEALGYPSSLAEIALSKVDDRGLSTWRLEYDHEQRWIDSLPLEAEFGEFSPFQAAEFGMVT